MDLGAMGVVGLIVLGIATIGFYGANYKLRAAVDEAVAPLKVPERRPGYNAKDLKDFRTKALERPTRTEGTALELYRQSVLPIDIGFAIALGLFSLVFWALIAPHVSMPLARSLCLAAGVAGLLYGVLDVCEDIVLRVLLQPDRDISELAASGANALTWLKIVTICLSGIGALVFFLLGVLFKLVQKA